MKGTGMDQGWRERLREAQEKMPQYGEMLTLAERFIEEKHRRVGEGGIKPMRIDAGKTATIRKYFETGVDIEVMRG